MGKRDKQFVDEASLSSFNIVIAHAERRRRRKKRLSMAYGAEREPRKALMLALRDKEKAAEEAAKLRAEFNAMVAAIERYVSDRTFRRLCVGAHAVEVMREILKMERQPSLTVYAIAPSGAVSIFTGFRVASCVIVSASTGEVEHYEFQLCHPDQEHYVRERFVWPHQFAKRELGLLPLVAMQAI